MKSCSTLKLLLVAIIGLFLSACATRPIIDFSQPPNNKGKILVVSKMPNEFHYFKVGTTVFQNQKYIFDITSWNLNGYIEDQISMSINDRFDVLIADEHQASVVNDYGGIFKGYKIGLTPSFKEMIAKDAIDYVIFVQINEKGYEDIFHYTNQYIKAYGAYLRETYWTNDCYEYTNLVISVYHPQTGKELLSNPFWSLTDDNRFIEHQKCSFPWKANESEARAQLPKLEPVIKKLLNKTIHRTISNFGMN